MGDGNNYSYEISELLNEVRSAQTQISEIISVSSENSEQFNFYMQQSLDNQTNHIILTMIVCGLLGIIIGICFVNIFKSR